MKTYILSRFGGDLPMLGLFLRVRYLVFSRGLV